jgi:hypothetical protein
MERPKDQCLLHPCAIGELFSLDKEEDGYTRGNLCCSFSPLAMIVTRALPLEAIKGEAGATSRKGNHAKATTHRSNWLELTATKHIHASTYHPSQETWDPLPLSKAYNPYYEHSCARQHEQQQNSLNVGPFMPELVYIIVSALHTI